MTRARESLALMRLERSPNPFLRELKGDSILFRKAAASVAVSGEDVFPQYETLGLSDIYLSYAGRFPRGHAIHDHLAQLEAGDNVFLAADQLVLTICDREGFCIGRLSKSASARWKEKLHRVNEVRVIAMIERDRMDPLEPFNDRIRSETWEVPVLEVVFAGNY